MDLSSVIESFAATYTVTRPARSTYTDGRLDVPTVSTFAISACVQPLTGRDLQRLPEGLRAAELLSVWTATELHTEGADSGPDSLSIDGESWQVQKVERWDTLGNYWKVIVSKAGH